MLESQMGKTCQFIGDPHGLYITVPLPDHSPLQRAPGNAISAILTLFVRLLFLPNLDFQLHRDFDIAFSLQGSYQM